MKPKTAIIMAMRGRNPDNPSDRKTHSNGRFRQRMEFVGVSATPSPR